MRGAVLKTVNATSLITVSLPVDGPCPRTAGLPARVAGGLSRPARSQVCGSGLLDQNGTGIEQVDALALRVLLGLRSWLGGDDGDVAASVGGVGEPGRQQRGMHTPATVRRCGRRPAELCDAFGHAQVAPPAMVPSRNAV